MSAACAGAAWVYRLDHTFRCERCGKPLPVRDIDDADEAMRQHAEADS